MKFQRVIHWFRQDLRLFDNPSLYEAAKQGAVLPIYILDNKNPGKQAMGKANRWWLHQSLTSLNHSLNNQLLVYQGDPLVILKQLIQEHGISAVYWNRCYEPWRIKRDARIKNILQQLGVEVRSFKASVLWEPWEVLKNDRTSYQVFTPFYKNGCLKGVDPRDPLTKPRNLKILNLQDKVKTIENLDLLSDLPATQGWNVSWSVGETAAKKRLSQFLKNGLQGYKKGRDYPAQPHVSRLSPYLHFGEISPNQIWYELKKQPNTDDLETFCKELAWREFSYHLLYYFPELPQVNLHKKFDQFPWRYDRKMLRCWQLGKTGYPIVDAGMRELAQTGYMHNRVRMIVASFLIKNLLLDWRKGEAWFWDYLVDADLANNSASWQWVAGCGADAAPYFRIFNPVIQGKKFDPDGKYIRKYLPELKQLPIKYLFNPWETPEMILTDLGIRLGKDYPKPIVDLKASRQRALMAYKSLRITT